LEPGSNGSEGITGVFVRKVVELAFEKYLMRANAVDFKTGSVGVVVVFQSKVVPYAWSCTTRKALAPGRGLP
jgi:hypothetical protein